MIVVWNKEEKILYNIPAPHSDLDIRKYHAYARDNDCGFFCKDRVTVFPEEGWRMDGNTYRLKNIDERLADKSETFDPLIEVIETNMESGEKMKRRKTLQEMITDGSIKLSALKEQAYTRIGMEVTAYLTDAKTSSGYLVNDYAQKIAMSTISMKDVPEDDEDKAQMLRYGLLYSIEKAREILVFLGQMKAARDKAVADITSAKNFGAVEKVKFSNYI